MASEQVVIHVRFFNDGSVQEIGERPAQLSPQAWFDLLNNKFATVYSALSGGRGVYKIPQADFSAVKAAV